MASDIWFLSIIISQKGKLLFALDAGNYYNCYGWGTQSVKVATQVWIFLAGSKRWIYKIKAIKFYGIICVYIPTKLPSNLGKIVS